MSYSFSIPGDDRAHDQFTRNSGGRTAFPTFYIEAVEDRPASEAEGRPIFKDVEYVRIMIAGDQKTEVVKKVTDAVRNQYGNEYRHWQATKQQSVTGTPIEQWPAAGASFVKTCKVLNVNTVEALADLPDAALQRIGMGSRDMQARARAFLLAAKDNAATEKLAAENNRLVDEIELLKRQIADMGARFAEMQQSEGGASRKSR
jgi:hypothetical protein